MDQGRTGDETPNSTLRLGEGDGGSLGRLSQDLSGLRECPEDLGGLGTTETLVAWVSGKKQGSVLANCLVRDKPQNSVTDSESLQIFFQTTVSVSDFTLVTQRPEAEPWSSPSLPS